MPENDDDGGIDFDKEKNNWKKKKKKKKEFLRNSHRFAWVMIATAKSSLIRLYIIDYIQM